MRLKVEPFEQWNPGPSFKTYQTQRAKFAARNSGTNTAVYNFSRFQLTQQSIPLFSKSVGLCVVMYILIVLVTNGEIFTTLILKLMQHNPIRFTTGTVLNILGFIKKYLRHVNSRPAACKNFQQCQLGCVKLYRIVREFVH